MSKILVEIDESVIASHFLRLNDSICILPWEPQKLGFWRTVRVRTNPKRDGVIFTMEENGNEITRTDIPFTVIFDWLPRLIALAEKGARL